MQLDLFNYVELEPFQLANGRVGFSIPEDA
jgi:hypothetical protein